jgi:hypothetical protein
VAWLPHTFQHTGLSYEPMDHRGNLACTRCHQNNTEAINWRYAAFQPDCAGCHANDYDPGEHRKISGTGTNYTASELRDCTGACHVYRDSSMTTISSRRPGPEHRVSSSGF